jgi:hypothetical protein
MVARWYVERKIDCHSVRACNFDLRVGFRAIIRVNIDGGSIMSARSKCTENVAVRIRKRIANNLKSRMSRDKLLSEFMAQIPHSPLKLQ